MDDMTYGGYDYRQNQRLWQRVAPSMAPYPESAWPPAAGGGMAGAAGTGMASSAGMTPSGGAVSPSGGAGMAPEAGTVNAGTSAASDAALESLPGAVSDPCCMGSAARDDLAVLEGFRDQEAADRRYYQAMLRLAPAAARPALRELMARKQAHSRYLGALLYLITGQSRPETLDCQRIYVGNWCPALRQRYHEEACGGFNYARTADSTSDVCLTRLLNELSSDEYRHAERVMSLLERSLTRRISC